MVRSFIQENTPEPEPENRLKRIKAPDDIREKNR